mgnify:CR=1 FL=1
MSAEPKTVRPPDIHAHRILILDFGAQYTQLIARRVRESGVYCEIHPWDMSDEDVRAFAARGIILSGGPESVTDAEPPRAPAAVFEAGVPVLGICYGMQTMAQQLGGRVTGSDHREFGYAQVTVTAPCRLFNELFDHRDPQGRAVLDVWMSHGDRVEEVPTGFVPVGSSPNAPLAAMADETRNYYAVQFHPEVTHTLQGGRMLERFVREICRCEARWEPGNIIADAVARVREQVGSDKVLLGLSGGVDSSVVAALLHRAIGDQLVCVFVDHGLLRADEGDQVMKMLGENMGVKIIRVNAEERFLDALRGEADPERKRKIIGRMFIEVFDEESNKLEGVRWLAQGTIYPDVIESAGAKTGKAHVIKSHHNVGGLPEHMKLKLVEPLRELFKDEVRLLGTVVTPDGMVLFDGTSVSSEQHGSMGNMSFRVTPVSIEVSTLSGKKYAAEYVGVDRFTQLGFAKITDPGTDRFTPVKFSPKHQFRIGSWLAAYMLLPEFVTPPVAADIGAGSVLSEENIAKVSITGVGMRSHPGVAARMFATLAREGINIMMISTSEIRISCLIEQKYAELAVQCLHTEFGLDAQ